MSKAEPDGIPPEFCTGPDVVYPTVGPERTTIDLLSTRPESVVAAVLEAIQENRNKGYYGPYGVSVANSVDLQQRYISGVYETRLLGERIKDISDVEWVRNYGNVETQTVTVSQLRPS